MLQYLAFRFSMMTLAYLPVSIGYFIACRVGDLSYIFVRRSRRIVCQNVKQVLGNEATGKQVGQTARRVFHNTAKNYFDLIRLPRFKPETFNHTLTIHGLQHYEEAARRGEGVVLATAHLGNFDLLAQVVALRSEKLTVLVEPLNPPRLFNLVTRLRGSQGLTLIPAGFGGLKGILRLLKRGETVVMACDRDVGQTGWEFDFMGSPARFPVGAVELALRTGAAVVPVFGVRQSNDRFAIYIEPPMELTRSSDHNADVRANMQRLLSCVESYVRRYPAQWVVFDPIWNNHRQPAAKVAKAELPVA